MRETLKIKEKEKNSPERKLKRTTTLHMHSKKNFTNDYMKKEKIGEMIVLTLLKVYLPLENVIILFPLLQKHQISVTIKILKN